MNRRIFLRDSALSILALTGISCSSKTTKQSSQNCWFASGDGPLYAPDSVIFSKEGLNSSSDQISREGALLVWKSFTDTPQSLLLPFVPHEIIQSAQQPHRVWVFEKWGRHFAEINLISFKVVRVKKIVNDSWLSGHGALSRNDQVLFVGQTGPHHGEVAVYRTEDLSLVHTFDTGGRFPHQMYLSDNDKCIQVINLWDRRPSSSNIISSLATIRLTESNSAPNKIFLSDEPSHFSHFLPLSENEWIIAGAKSYVTPQSRSKVHLIQKSGDVRTLPIPDSLNVFGQSLSLAIDHNRRLLAATFPYSGHVILWNIDDFSFHSVIRSQTPRGVAFDRENRTLAFTIKKNITDGSLNMTSDVHSFNAQGSHLTALTPVS